MLEGKILSPFFSIADRVPYTNYSIENDKWAYDVILIILKLIKLPHVSNPQVEKVLG